MRGEIISKNIAEGGQGLLELLYSYPVRVAGLGLTLIVTILWGASIYARVLHHGVRRAVLLMLAMLLLWELDRIIKLQTPVKFVELDHLYWYLFYIFRGALPVVFLWIAASADANVLQEKMPHWIKSIFAINIIFAVFILLNDWHGQVFTFAYDEAARQWRDGLNWGAYLYWTLWFCELMAALIILWWKAEKEHVFYWAMFLPFFLYALFLYYSIAYHYVEIFHRSELTGVTATFFLLLMEICLRTGLMPSNSRHRLCFTQSTIPMQLFHCDGSIALQSQLPPQIKAETRLASMPLRGGRIVWYEDLHVLHDHQHRLRLLQNGLQRQQNILKRRQEIQQKQVQQETRKRLYEEINAILEAKKPYFARYRQLLLHEKNEVQVVWILRRMNALAAYLKQRCLLYLKGEKKASLPVAELQHALDISNKYLEPLGIHAGFIWLGKQDMATEAALLLFDFCDELLLSLAVQQRSEKRREILVKILPAEGTLSLMLEADAGLLQWLQNWLGRWQQKHAVQVQLRDLGFAQSILCRTNLTKEIAGK